MTNRIRALKDYLQQWFWHPVFRIFLAAGVIVLNAIFLAEDPMARSSAPANVVIVGLPFNFVFGAYHTHAALIFTKVVMWVTCLVVGVWFGYVYLHGKFLRDYLELEMFGFDSDEDMRRSAEEGSGQRYKGSWAAICVSAAVFLIIGARLYNLIIYWTENDPERFYLTDVLPMQFRIFMMLASGATLVGNFLTFTMVLDGMLTTLRSQLSNLTLWHRAATLLLARVHITSGSLELLARDSHLDVKELEKKVPPTALKSFRKTFELFDLDNDGVVGFEEGIAMLQAMLPDVPESTLRSMFQAIDRNHDGGMEWKEFLVLMASRRPTTNQLKEAFNFLDVKCSGHISMTELGRYLMQTQPGCVALSAVEIAAVLREIDINGDGIIDFDDFAYSVRNLLPKEPNFVPKDQQEVLERGRRVQEGMAETLKLSKMDQALSMKFRRKYTRFCPWLVSRWEGNFRLGCLAFMVIVPTVVVLVVVFMGLFTRWTGSSDEISRTLMAALRMMGDLLIVVQDWEFPTFTQPHLPGQYAKPAIDISLPWPCAPSRKLEIQITGKWFNYGLVLLLLILDINFIKNQLIYVPSDFNQVIIPDTGEICNPLDPALLNATDMPRDELDCFGSRYEGGGIFLKLLCLLPALFGVFIFFSLIVLHRWRARFKETVQPSEMVHRPRIVSCLRSFTPTLSPLGLGKSMSRSMSRKGKGAGRSLTPEAPMFDGPTSSVLYDLSDSATSSPNRSPLPVVIGNGASSSVSASGVAIDV